MRGAGPHGTRLPQRGASAPLPPLRPVRPQSLPVLQQCASLSSVLTPVFYVFGKRPTQNLLNVNTRPCPGGEVANKHHDNKARNILAMCPTTSCKVGRRGLGAPCQILWHGTDAELRQCGGCSDLLQVQQAGASGEGLHERLRGDRGCASLPALRSGGLPRRRRAGLCQVSPAT